jgi:hypothetical protein
MVSESVIIAASDELNITYDAAKEFLESETGCYADIDGESIWMSGQFIGRLMEAAREY